MLIIIGYFIIGIVLSRGIKDASDYFPASRSICRWLVIGASLFAANISSEVWDGG